MTNPIRPSIGRLVLLTVIAANAQPREIPAVVTDVHSDHCISVVGLAAFSVQGLHAGGTVPKTSVLYDEDKDKADTWRWMPYQVGQAQKTDEVKELLAKRVGELESLVAKLGTDLAALNAKQPATQRVTIAEPAKTDVAGGPDASAQANPPLNGDKTPSDGSPTV